MKKRKKLTAFEKAVAVAYKRRIGSVSTADFMQLWQSECRKQVARSWGGKEDWIHFLKVLLHRLYRKIRAIVSCCMRLWGTEVSKCLFTPDKAQVAAQRNNPTEVQLNKPLCLLGSLTRVWVKGDFSEEWTARRQLYHRRGHPSLGAGWLIKAKSWGTFCRTCRQGTVPVSLPLLSSSCSLLL